MMKNWFHRWQLWPTERLSSRVLYVLVAIVVLVFALFWLIGYDRPYDEDPNFVAPLFTDAVLVLAELLVVLALGLAVWSVVRALKIRGRGEKTSNNIPVKKIEYAIGIGTVVVLLLTFALASTAPMTINGQPYTDAFWLRVSDMFINTTLVMMAFAIASMIYGATRYKRKQ